MGMGAGKRLLRVEGGCSFLSPLFGEMLSWECNWSKYHKENQGPKMESLMLAQVPKLELSAYPNCSFHLSQECSVNCSFGNFPVCTLRWSVVIWALPSSTPPTLGDEVTCIVYSLPLPLREGHLPGNLTFLLLIISCPTLFPMKALHFMPLCFLLAGSLPYSWLK